MLHRDSTDHEAGPAAAPSLAKPGAQRSSSTSIHHGVRIGAILAAILAGTSLVYLTGGTKHAYPHILYLALLLGAHYYGAPGGLVAGAIAGLWVGPWMPLDVARGLPQPAVGWVSRTAFFVLIGGAAGVLMDVNKRRLARNRRLMREISEGYGRILRTFSRLVSMRDESTGGHCDRVALNAVTVGDALGLSADELHNLYWAGILHDLGKVVVPAPILLKPGRLTDEEYRRIKEHVTYGADLLVSASPNFERIAEAVRAHHERWNGSGYPDGLRSEEIPLAGRILAVVDVFEALTSERPYRGPRRPEDALAYLRRNAGVEFDPRVVEVFEDIFSAGKIQVVGLPEPVPAAVPPIVREWAA